MDKTQETALRTLVIIFVIFIIILDYGNANEDRTQSQDLNRALGNSKVPVALVAYQGPRRERDVGLNNPNDCYSDEYWSDYYSSCKACTRCSPGTQHDPPEWCGNGQGQEAHCIPCEKGSYQNTEGIAILTCQPCLVCDPRAVMERVCSRRKNTVCGRCQKGWYYDETNVCVECTEADMADSTNEDCYDEPDPTPGPELSPEPPPFLYLQPAQPGLSTTAPKPVVNGASPGPNLKPTPGEVGNPQPQTQLGRLEVALIGGAIAAAICLVAGVIFIIYSQKKKKEKDHPPRDEHEMENLYVHVYQPDIRKPPGPGSLPVLDVQPNSTVPTYPSSKEDDSSDFKDNHSDTTDDGSKLSADGSSRTLIGSYSDDTEPSRPGPLSDPLSLKSTSTLTSDGGGPYGNGSDAVGNRLPDTTGDGKKDVEYLVQPTSGSETLSGFSNDDTEPMSGYGPLTSYDEPPRAAETA